MIMLFVRSASGQKKDSTKSAIESQLELALAWNRADVAKDEILTAERRAEWKVSQAKLGDLRGNDGACHGKMHGVSIV